MNKERKFRIHNITDRVKTIPLQAWTDPEGSKRLKLPVFRTIGT